MNRIIINGKETIELIVLEKKCIDGKFIRNTESNSVRPAIWVTIG